MEDSNELIVVRKNWWDRNWKWFVPTGCLGLIILFALFIGGIFLGVTSMINDSDAFKGAMTEVKHNKIVIEKLGSPIETDGMTSGNISTSNNNSGNCDLQIPIKGSKGKGTLFVIATKRGNWEYQELSVFVEKSKEKIDLLKK